MIAKRALVVSWLSLLAAASPAQTYTIDWSAITAGSATLTGGGYTLDGTVGDTAPGAALSSFGYTLEGGFLPGSQPTTPGQWVLRATNGPPARFAHAMAYDSTRGVTVLYGGGQVVTNVGYVGFGDVWEWNGAAWRQRTTYAAGAGWTRDAGGYWVPAYVDVPVGRMQHGMAYDSRRGRIVIFGGRSATPDGGDALFGDTWEWDGLRWRLGATNGPSKRIDPAMAYDSQRGVTVMCAGFGGSDYGVVWEWDGRTWKSTLPTNGPPSNFYQNSAVMAYDGALHEAFFGPATDGFRGVYFFGWNGQYWDSFGAGFTASIPAPPYGTMAYDDYRKRVVFFGGQNNAAFKGGNTTAFWDGTGWTMFPPSSSTSLFSSSDLLNVANLVTQLSTQSDPVSQFLWSQFSSAGQLVLGNPNSTPDEQRSALTNELDHVVTGPSIYDSQRFAGVTLSTETLLLQPLNPQGADLIRFNRLLLEDAYPLELAKSPATPCGRFRLGSAYDSRRHAFVVFGGSYDGQTQLVGNETWELITPDELIINQEPLSQFRQPGANASFGVSASGPAGATLAYRWSFNGQALADTGRIFGSQTPNLQIAGVTLADAGQYQVQVSDGQWTVDSLPASLSLNPSLQLLTARSFSLLWGASNVVLQFSDFLPGTWNTVPGAASPFDFSTFGPGQFFRLQPAGPTH